MVTFICLFVIYMVIGTIKYDKFLIIYGRSQGNQWRRMVPKSVCVWGRGGGGAHTRNLCIFGKNQYKLVVFGYIVIY